ncbi:hypothetical protein JX265_010466 [Neoarthrinium moseri]|uniref:Uncharacterized protein n=1 Tax=Neoarthrinium moseri TaxID=1658444 RepID=A0A9P9WEL3_9PEZI|nr:hypothetical protein JX266_008190 [Neoarthrinium moseri]KAI1859463.1 hypothetical protein JX265_010466 [Neoarthrinium moseri]
MATRDTAELSQAHAPKEASLAAYSEFESELKRTLLHERHDKAKHELPYFEAAAHLSDADFTSFTQSDFETVRHAQVAYGHILFGKLKIPALAGSKNCYIHFRAFEPEPGTDKKAEVHSIHTERKEEPDGGFKYRALFTKEDPLEWFDT